MAFDRFLDKLYIDEVICIILNAQRMKKIEDGFT